MMDDDAQKTNDAEPPLSTAPGHLALITAITLTAAELRSHLALNPGGFICIAVCLAAAVQIFRKRVPEPGYGALLVVVVITVDACRTAIS